MQKMYGLRCDLCIFLAMLALQTVLGAVPDERNDKPDSNLVAVPINSKFLHPQLDDKTNMELIGANNSNKTVVEVSAKELRHSEKNSAGEELVKGKRNDRYLVWGLLNMLKPMVSPGGLPEAFLRSPLRSGKEIRDSASIGADRRGQYFRGNYFRIP